MLASILCCWLLGSVATAQSPSSPSPYRPAYGYGRPVMSNTSQVRAPGLLNDRRSGIPEPRPRRAPVRTMRYRKRPSPPPTARRTTAHTTHARIRQVQQEDFDNREAEEDVADSFELQLKPPSREDLFRLESEKELEDRIQEEERKENPDLEPEAFPPYPVLSKVEFEGRTFPPGKVVKEPNYVCYRRLFFEDLNHERYGWDLGLIQPLWSAVRFYRDVITLPHNFASFPHIRYESNAGYCLPGDPVPYLAYPPTVTASGLGLTTGIVLLLYGVIP